MDILGCQGYVAVCHLVSMHGHGSHDPWKDSSTRSLLRISQHHPANGTDRSVHQHGVMPATTFRGHGRSNVHAFIICYALICHCEDCYCVWAAAQSVFAIIPEISSSPQKGVKNPRTQTDVTLSQQTRMSRSSKPGVATALHTQQSPEDSGSDAWRITTTQGVMLMMTQ